MVAALGKWLVFVVAIVSLIVVMETVLQALKNLWLNAALLILIYLQSLPLLKGLGYSKDLEMHKLGVALHFGLYNFVRKHSTLGTTPAVAAGIELERWSLERVAEMTAEYMRRKEDAEFEAAFSKLLP